jgi:Ca-activated chloride channel family protein
MTQPTFLLSPIKSAISADGGVLEVMLRVQAPDQNRDLAAKPTRKRLAMVVDRSGSMNGQPLTEALRCVAHVASRLTPDDQMTVVVYDHCVNVLYPLGPVLSPQAIQDAIAQIESGGNTNLFGGWETGAQQLEGGIDSSISRVLLLSDGQANHGLCQIDAIEQHCRDWLAKGVSTTTVGLGRGFNDDLMIAMARAGGGQQYYGQMAEDLFDNFDEELSLLHALYLRQLAVKLIPASGVIVEPLGLVQQHPDGSYQLSDLAWGAEAWLMVRLHVSADSVGVGGDARDLLAATLEARTLEGQTITTHASMLRLPVLPQIDVAALAVDELVHRRLQEVDFAESSQALRQLVQLGDIYAARALLTELEKRFAKHPWLLDKLAHLRELAAQDPELMSKEVRFSGMRMSNRLSEKFEVQYSCDETDFVIPAFLRKKAQEGKGRKSPPNNGSQAKP